MTRFKHMTALALALATAVALAPQIAAAAGSGTAHRASGATIPVTAPRPGPADNIGPQPPQPLVAPGAGGDASRAPGVTAPVTAPRPGPIDDIGPQPPQPETGGDAGQESLDNATLRFPTEPKIARVAISPCCEGRRIVGGGFATRSSNVTTDGRVWERIDAQFSMRLPAGIPTLDTRAELADVQLVIAFRRGNRVYAECGLELDPYSRTTTFSLAVESLDQRIIMSEGYCDVSPATDRFRDGVPQLDVQDTVEVFAFGERLGKVQLASSASIGF